MGRHSVNSVKTEQLERKKNKKLNNYCDQVIPLHRKSERKKSCIQFSFFSIHRSLQRETACLCFHCPSHSVSMCSHFQSNMGHGFKCAILKQSINRELTFIIIFQRMNDKRCFIYFMSLIDDAKSLTHCIFRKQVVLQSNVK